MLEGQLGVAFAIVIYFFQRFLPDTKQKGSQTILTRGNKFVVFQGLF